jgi:hypothetical protein
MAECSPDVSERMFSPGAQLRLDFIHPAFATTLGEFASLRWGLSNHGVLARKKLNQQLCL